MEPTNETPRTSGWSSSALTASASPCTTLRTPAGSPASANHCAISVEAVGSFSDGLSTTALPQATAIGTNHSGTMAGKLNGEITATTPSGWRMLYESTAVDTFSLKPPRTRAGMPQAYSTTSSPRCTSPAASSSTLPCSAVIAAASSARRALTISRNANSTAVRRARDTSRHERAAAAADGHDGVDVGRRGERHVGRDLTGRRVEHLAAAPAGALPRLPVDKWFTRRVTRASTARIASTRMPRASRASASVSVSGGPIRITLPYRPPLPTSRPRALHSSNTRPVAAASGSVVPGCDELDRQHQALAADLRHDRAALRELVEPGAQDRARAGRVALQVVVEHVVEHRVAGGRRDRVAAERGEGDRRHRRS